MAHTSEFLEHFACRTYHAMLICLEADTFVIEPVELKLMHVKIYIHELFLT